MNFVTIRKSSRLGRYYNFLASLSEDTYATHWVNLTLCSFVRRLFFGTLKLAVIALILLAFLVFGLVCVAAMFYLPWYLITQGFSIPEEREFEGAFLTLGFMGWVVVLVGLFIFLEEGLKAKLKKRSLKKIQNGSSGSGLFRAWLKAKKQKVCPAVEVID